MSAPIGPNPVSPPKLLERLKESGEKFEKLSLGQKFATVALTIFTGLPTLGIGGVFTFIGCSEMFASKGVKVKTPDNKTPIIKKMTESFKNAFPIDKAMSAPSSKMNAKEREKMTMRLVDLDDKVDELDLKSRDAAQSILKIRETLINERLSLKDKDTNELDLIESLIESIEGKLAVQEVKFFMEAEASKDEASIIEMTSFIKDDNGISTLESKFDNLSFDSFDNLQEAFDLLTDIQKRIEVIDNIFDAPEIEASLKRELQEMSFKLQDLEAKLTDKVSGHQAQIYSLFEKRLEDESLAEHDQDAIATQVIKMSETLPKDESFNGLKNASLERVEAMVPKGIKNIGNSCYINSTMQALISNESIKKMIMSPWPVTAKDDKQKQIERNLQDATQEFVRQLDQSKAPREMERYASNLRDAILATGSFAQQTRDEAEDLIDRAALKGRKLGSQDALDIAKSKQHDAAELATLLLDMIGYSIAYNIIREVPDKNMLGENNLVQNLLPVDIKAENNKPILVQNLIEDLFTTKVMDSAENDWRGEVKYNETINLGNNPPEQIILQFKRFVPGKNLGTFNKINDNLVLPKDHIIDFSKGFKGAEENSVRYKVTGAIHHGGSLTGGHYRAFNEKGGEWYEANDQAISKPQNIDRELASAYILILERVPQAS